MAGSMQMAEAVFGLAGGLAFFLYGITLLAEGLRETATQQLRRLTATLTRSPLAAFGIGALLTVFLQSSSAATVMVVSFIDAGLLSLWQSGGIILGCGLGSTLTAHLITFRLFEIMALPIVAVGAGLHLFGGTRTTRRIGQCVLGFGLLFFGFVLMKTAVQHWQDTSIRSWFLMLAEPSLRNRLLGMLVATMATAIVQSSAATIGIIMALAGQGAITSLDAAIPLAIGCNIGTTATALLASIGRSGMARRASVFYLVFRILAGLLVLACQSWFVQAIPHLSDNLVRQIALFHTLENALTGLLFLPVSRPLMRLVAWIVPAREGLTPAPLHIDFSRRAPPAEACQQAFREVVRVLGIVRGMASDSVQGVLRRDARLLESVLHCEMVVDTLHTTITRFLLTLGDDVPPDIHPGPAALVQAVHHAERVGDHAENLAELARLKISGEPALPPVLQTTLAGLGHQLDELAGLVEQALQANDAGRIAAIDAAGNTVKEQCIEELWRCRVAVTSGLHTALAGTLFEDIVANLQSSGSHLRKMAHAIFGYPPPEENKRPAG
ncbi:MAG: hypothetical protein A2269_09460 [Lentisphaerae bacterium RIFOXYA12_FULL_60_10]|nr:MAG: hypothetical protein A2269_09460 [Lentisphaerae bacterium RIFOXYA12_FULL_60_10]